MSHQCEHFGEKSSHYPMLRIVLIFQVGFEWEIHWFQLRNLIYVKLRNDIGTEAEIWTESCSCWVDCSQKQKKKKKKHNRFTFPQLTIEHGANWSFEFALPWNVMQPFLHCQMEEILGLNLSASRHGKPIKAILSVIYCSMWAYWFKAIARCAEM